MAAAALDRKLVHALVHALVRKPLRTPFASPSARLSLPLIELRDHCNMTFHPESRPLLRDPIAASLMPAARRSFGLLLTLALCACASLAGAPVPAAAPSAPALPTEAVGAVIAAPGTQPPPRQAVPVFDELTAAIGAAS
ncbi:MAG: hypothetical protein ABIN96_04580, partial [Rubrivivax sp.]